MCFIAVVEVGELFILIWFLFHDYSLLGGRKSVLVLRFDCMISSFGNDILRKG